MSTFSNPASEDLGSKSAMATKQQCLRVNQADGEAGYARNSSIQVSSHCNPLYFLCVSNPHYNNLCFPSDDWYNIYLGFFCKLNYYCSTMHEFVGKYNVVGCRGECSPVLFFENLNRAYIFCL